MNKILQKLYMNIVVAQIQEKLCINLAGYNSFYFYIGSYKLIPGHVIFP